MESSTRVTLRPSTIATAVLTPSILLLLPHICTARSDFAPDPPVHILAYEDHLLNPYAGPLDRTGGATVHLRSEDIPRGKLILKFDFQKEQVSYIHDENLPENIYAFADNGDHIFAGGDGLAVFHKNSGKWERWSEFNFHKIWDIVVDDSTLWLGTSGGVIHVDLNDQTTTKRYSESEGLNADGVYSLCMEGNLLLVGTYRQGRDIDDINRERVEDIFGLGLSQIDLTSGLVRAIELPQWTSQQATYINGILVVAMYEAAGMENTVKIVTWKPWETRCWDYDYKTGEFSQSESQYYQLDRVLNLHEARATSPLVEHIVDYIVTLRLDNWGGGNPEIMKLIYDRQDFPLMEALLSDPNPGVRGRIISGISGIYDPRMTEYLLAAMKDDHSGNFGCAVKALVGRKEIRAIEPLRATLQTNDRSRLLIALRALVDFEDPIIRDIMVGVDDSLKSTLGWIFWTGGDEAGEYLEKIIAKPSEPVSLRRAAIQYLDGRYGCKDGEITVIRNKSLKRFLETAIENENEDEIIRRHAQSLVNKINERLK